MTNVFLDRIWEDNASLKLIDGEKIWVMVCRALNLIDRRLVDHGIKVALVLEDMLKVEGQLDQKARSRLGIMALFHDIGAYRIDEIDKLLQFETKNVWQHAIYSYLFLKPFFSEEEHYVKAVLYHHARYDECWEEGEDVLHYGQLMHMADRVCIWHDELKGSREALEEYLSRKSGSIFSPMSVELFRKADRQYETWNKLDADFPLERLISDPPLSVEETNVYLHLLVEAIDFRSRTTVLHTKGVIEIALKMAQLLEMSEALQQKVYYGALLHDLGKIGTPLSVLEKPGRLTPEEMDIMRQHVVLSEQIVSGCVEEEMSQIGLRHHEKLNGSGYPKGLTAAELTQPQRLVAVADVLSALCMNRSYKSAFPKEKCLSILWDMVSRGDLDKEMVSLVEREFDSIIATAAERSAGVEDMYLKMQKEFQTLMERYSVENKVGSGL